MYGEAEPPQPHEPQATAQLPAGEEPDEELVLQRLGVGGMQTPGARTFERESSAAGSATFPQSPTESTPGGLATPSAEASDARFFGSLKSTGDTYGFISCRQTQETYKRDVYIAKAELGDDDSWTIGQTVSFKVVLNDKGRPQAREVQLELSIPEEAVASEPLQLPPSKSKQTPAPISTSTPTPSSSAPAPPWLESPLKSTKSETAPRSLEMRPQPSPASPWADINDDDLEDEVDKKSAEATKRPLPSERLLPRQEQKATPTPSLELRSPGSAAGKSPGLQFGKAPPIFTEEEEDDELGEWGRRRRLLPPATPVSTMETAPGAVSSRAKPERAEEAGSTSRDQASESQTQSAGAFGAVGASRSASGAIASSIPSGPESGILNRLMQSGNPPPRSPLQERHFEEEVTSERRTPVGLTLTTIARGPQRWGGTDNDEEIDAPRREDWGSQGRAPGNLAPDGSANSWQHGDEGSQNWRNDQYFNDSYPQEPKPEAGWGQAPRVPPPPSPPGEKLCLPEALWSRTDLVRALCFKRPRRFLLAVESELMRLLQAPEGAVLRLKTVSPHYHSLLQALCKRFATREEIDSTGSETVLSTTSSSFAPLLPLAALVPQTWAGSNPSSWEERRRGPWMTRKSLAPCPGLNIPLLCDLSEFMLSADDEDDQDDAANLSGFGGRALSSYDENNSSLDVRPGEWMFLDPPTTFKEDGLVVTFSINHQAAGDGIGVALCPADLNASQEALQRLLAGVNGEPQRRSEGPINFHVLLVQPQGENPAGTPRWLLRFGHGEQAVQGQWSDSRTLTYQDQQESSASSSSSSSTFWLATYPGSTDDQEDNGMIVEAGLGRFPWGSSFRTRVRSGCPMEQVAVGAQGRGVSLSAVSVECGVCPDLAGRDHLVKLTSSNRGGTASAGSPWWLQQGAVALLDGLAVCENVEAALTLEQRCSSAQGHWQARTLATKSLDARHQTQASGESDALRKARAKSVAALGRATALELGLDDWVALDVAENGDERSTSKSKKPPLPAPPKIAPPPPPAESHNDVFNGILLAQPVPPVQPLQPQNSWETQSRVWGNQPQSTQGWSQDSPGDGLDQWDQRPVRQTSPMTQMTSTPPQWGSSPPQQVAPSSSFSPPPSSSNPCNQISLFADEKRIDSVFRPLLGEVKQSETFVPSLSAEAPAFTPGASNENYQSQGAGCGENYQGDMYSYNGSAADGWGYDEGMAWQNGWSQEGYNSYTSEAPQEPKEPKESSLSSNALPFIPGEAAAVTSAMNAGAQEFNPAMAFADGEYWEGQAQEGYWDMEGSEWPQEEWAMEGMSAQGGKDWGGKGGKSFGKGWGKGDGRGWEGEKGWEGKGKGWDGKGKGKGVDISKGKGNRAWEGMSKGKGFQLEGKGKNGWDDYSDAWDAKGKGKDWDSKGKAWDYGKGWESSSSSKTREVKGKDGKGWEKGWGGERGDWGWGGEKGEKGKSERGKGWQGESGKGWEAPWEDWDEKGKGKGRQSNGDAWRGEWEENWEWRSEWRGAEKKKGDDGKGSWKEEWPQDRRKGQDAAAPQRGQRAQTGSGGKDRSGPEKGGKGKGENGSSRRPPMRRRGEATSSDSEDQASSSGASAPGRPAKGKGNGKGRFRKQEEVQSSDSSEDEKGEKEKSRNRDAKGRGGRGRSRGGKGEGDETQSRQQLRRQFQQEREAEKRRAQGLASDDDEAGAASRQVDKSALRRHLGL